MSSVVNCFALDKQFVKIDQFVAVPRETYVSFPSPQLPVGLVKLNYDFTVEAKDNAHAVIDCLIKFPKDLKVEVLSHDGIQAIELQENDIVPGIAIYNDKKGNEYTYCEFLIPQKNGGIGFIEFQLNISENFRGKDIPIEFNFEHFKKSVLLRYGTAIGIAAGIATGIVVGALTVNPAAGVAAGTATGVAAAGGAIGTVALSVGAGAGVTAGFTYFSYQIIKDSLQEMKKKYASKKMNDSYKRFTLQIR